MHLPIAHCVLNPIEMARATMKSFIWKSNKGFKLKEAQALVPAAFNEVTPEMWANMCRHVLER